MSKGLFKTALEEAEAEAEKPAEPDDGDCRKCCGGHGYLMASGVAHQWADYAWQATAEGDPVVMLLQTARFLIKQQGGVTQCAAARAGEPLPGTTDYLAPLKDRAFD
eukprot:gene22103-7502_t